MKRFSLLCGLAVCGSAMAQFPVESVAMRKPMLKTTGDLLIRNARILTVTRGIIERGDLLIQKGKIVAIGKVDAPAGVPVIDATGKVVAPGWVDAHVHRGTETTNEGSDAIVAEGRILDVLNPDAKNVWQALASGETSALVLHGSANPVGAESLVSKLRYGRNPNDFAIPDAPRMIKFALGENVTRSGTATSTRYPRTRMGVESVYRRAFTQAREYGQKWDAWNARKPGATQPERDLRLETLNDILKRKIWVQCHSYRADEILMMVRLSQEFGFKIGAMQHALESYKVAPELAKAGVGASIFVDNWASKLEMYDAIPFAASILHRAGVNVSINTDGTSGTTAINIDAAKTMRFGGLSENEALRLITINPAKQLGISHRVGSLEVGKDGDVVIWDGHPLSVYARVDTTIIEGEVMFQRRDLHRVNAGSTLKNVLDPVTYTPNPAVPAKANVYAIVGGRVHTVSGPVLENGTVVVRDGKIVAVGRKVAVPKNAVVVQAAGLNVYPGFIDAGTGIGLTEFGQIGQATDAREAGSFQADLVSGTAVNAQSEHIPATRSAGVTNALTRMTGGTVSGHATLLELAGFTSEQMAFRRKAGMMVSWPGGGGGGFGEEVDSHNSHNDGCEDDHLLGGGAAQGAGGGGASETELKNFWESAVKYPKEKKETNLPLEAMQPVVAGQVPVFFRVRNAESIRNAVAFAKERKIKPILVGAPDAWREAKLLAANKIPVIITPAGLSLLGANTTSNDWDPYDTPYALPTLLKRAGVKFAFQSEDYSESKDLPFRVGQHCAYGLSPADALRALTLSAAEILGVANELGSVSVGKRANLVITAGDAFEPTGSVRYVFINGKPVPLTSKFTRLRDQYSERLAK